MASVIRIVRGLASATGFVVLLVVAELFARGDVEISSAKAVGTIGGVKVERRAVPGQRWGVPPAALGLSALARKTCRSRARARAFDRREIDIQKWRKCWVFALLFPVPLL